MLAHALRLELNGEPIRVVEVAPGMVYTEEFTRNRLGGDQNAAEKVYEGVVAPLVAADVADVIAYALNAPGHVNLDMITMRPVAQSAQHLLARGPLTVRAELTRHCARPGSTDTEDDMTENRERLTWDAFGEAARDLAREHPGRRLLARGRRRHRARRAHPGRGGRLRARREELRRAQRRVLHRHRHGARCTRSCCRRTSTSTYLEGRRVLLVDDVADSGRTLKLAVELLRGRGADVRSVTIYTKPGSIEQPDYSWRETDLWIDFPWSAQGPVSDESALGA